MPKKKGKAMNNVLRAIARGFYWLVIRDLERQLNDQMTCMRNTYDADEFQRIYFAKVQTCKELAAARAAYSVLLPVGQRKTWGQA